jgi:uncharacterized protein
MWIKQIGGGTIPVTTIEQTTLFYQFLNCQFMPKNENSNRGFGSMDPEQQREIASEGGRAAHESGNANEFTSEEAREAGRKGGESVSRDREHMKEIGRKGGENSRGGQ